MKNELACKGKNVAVVGDSIVKTNIYRCTEYCPNCPFLDDGEKIGLRSGRVYAIKKMLLESDSNSFTCHKTAYSLNNNMEQSKKQKPKMCYGAYRYLESKSKPNIAMRLARSLGVDTDEPANP
jgi:hypothetical protein